MKQKFVKYLSTVLALALFITLLPAYSVKAASDASAQSTIVHYVNSDYLDQKSIAGNYIFNFATVTENDKNYIEFDVRDFPNYNMNLKMYVTNPDGELAEGEILGVVSSTPTPVDTRMRFEVASFDEKILAQASYNMPGTGALHEPYFYIVINNDIDALKVELTALIAEATAVSNPSTALTDAIVAAKDANNYLTWQADMQAAYDALYAALHPTITFEPATVHYVSPTNSNLLVGMPSGYLQNFKTYELDGKTYLRVDVQQSLDLKFAIGTHEGTKVAEYEAQVTGYGGAVSTVTFYTLDYEIGDITSTPQGYISYNAGGVRKHDFVLILNNDIDALKVELAAAITEAEAITNPNTALTTALTAAKAANNYVTWKSDMQAALDALKAELNPEEVTPVSTKIHFVNHGDTTKLSSMGSYLSNAKTYEKNGKTYLRIDVQQVYDVKFVLGNDEGTKVAEYVGQVTGRDGKVSDVTFFTIDYEVSDINSVLEGKVSYVVPNIFPDGSTHDVYIVLGNDIDALKVELAAAITEADKITNKNTALTTALTTAKAANNYVTWKADMQAALNTLKAAIQGNTTGGGGTTPTTPSPDVNESSGLEVGKYELNVSILHSSKDESSIMQSYFLSGRLEVTKTKMYLYLLMSGADMIQDIIIEGNTASVANNYSKLNIKRYKIEVDSIEGTLYGTSHVIVKLDGFGYDENHSIRFKLGTPIKVDKWELEEDLVTPSNPSDSDNTDDNTEESPNGGSTDNESSTGGNNSQVTFTDTKDHWASANIDRAIALGITTGYADGTFKPSATVSRAEFTAFLARAFQLPASTDSLTFADASTIKSWAQPFIQSAIKAGIIGGYADQTFRPENNISRGEIAIMLVRALNLELESADSLTFTDADQIPAYAKAAVATAVKYGLITGYANGTFAANTEATRAEAITMILRAIDYAQGKK